LNIKKTSKKPFFISINKPFIFDLPTIYKIVLQ